MTDQEEHKMSEIQKQETKRAFFGAAATMLVTFREHVGAIEDENEAIAVLEGMMKETQEFWNAQI